MKRRIGWWTIAVVMAVVFGCGDLTETAVESPDARDATAFVGGKADGPVGACHREHMLLMVNDPGIDEESLVDAGVHRRAAAAIADFRAGSDGEIGTGTDRYVDDVQKLDAIDYVGPVAARQLGSAVDEYCTDVGDWRSAEPVFSPADGEETHLARIVDEIEAADTSIDMAMYAISDRGVVDALGDAVDRGVSVRLLFDEANGDHLRMEGTTSARLEDRGVDVRYVNRSMHHKFAIIDGPRNELMEASRARFFSGSANLSYVAARRYDENTAFHHRDPALIVEMQREFNHLWDHSRNVDWNDAIEQIEPVQIDAAMIPPRRNLEVLLTSENFETTESARWGPGFRPRPTSEVVVDRLVELIDGAEDSIWIASRFFRSRPIAEALERRWRDDPDLDIRVYLDQAEYSTADDYEEQVADMEDCLAEAGDDDADVFGCRRSGVVFGYPLAELGIDIRFKTYAYHWHPSYAEQMHHKYMIIDERTVATGSYNYSHNAETNSMENVVIYRRAGYPQVVDRFVDNFESIWNEGGGPGSFDDLVDEIAGDQRVELVFESVALRRSQVTELYERIRQECPDVDDEDFSADRSDDPYC